MQRLASRACACVSVRPSATTLELQGDGAAVGREVHGEGATERGDDGVGVAAVGHDGALAGQLLELAGGVLGVSGVQRAAVGDGDAVDAGLGGGFDKGGHVKVILDGQALVGKDAAVPVAGLVGQRGHGFLGGFAVGARDRGQAGGGGHAQHGGNVGPGGLGQRGQIADPGGSAQRAGLHGEALPVPRAGSPGGGEGGADDGGDAVHVGRAGEVEAGDVLGDAAHGNGEAAVLDGSPRGSVGLAVGEDAALEDGWGGGFAPASHAELRGAGGLGEIEFGGPVFRGVHAEVGGHAVDAGIGAEAFLHVDDAGSADDEQRTEIAPGRRHRLEIDADADDAVHAQSSCHDKTPVSCRGCRNRAVPHG